MLRCLCAMLAFICVIQPSIVHGRHQLEWMNPETNEIKISRISLRHYQQFKYDFPAVNEEDIATMWKRVENDYSSRCQYLDMGGSINEARIIDSGLGDDVFQEYLSEDVCDEIGYVSTYDLNLPDDMALMRLPRGKEAILTVKPVENKSWPTLIELRVKIDDEGNMWVNARFSDPPERGHEHHRASFSLVLNGDSGSALSFSGNFLVVGDAWDAFIDIDTPFLTRVTEVESSITDAGEILINRLSAPNENLTYYIDKSDHPLSSLDSLELSYIFGGCAHALLCFLKPEFVALRFDLRLLYYDWEDIERDG